MGYLKYSSAIGQYEIGPRVLALSFSLNVQAAAAYSCQAADERLSSRGKRSCRLSILDDLKCGLHRHGRRRPCPLSVVLRSDIVYHCSHHHGMGMSFGNESTKRINALERIRQAYPDDHKIMENIERGIAEIWERGFCISMGLFDPGSNAVGVPYLHPDGRHILAFNLTAPKTVLTRKSIETKWGRDFFLWCRTCGGSGSILPFAEMRRRRLSVRKKSRSSVSSKGRSTEPTTSSSGCPAVVRVSSVLNSVHSSFWYPLPRLPGDRPHETIRGTAIVFCRHGTAIPATNPSVARVAS